MEKLLGTTIGKKGVLPPPVWRIWFSGNQPKDFTWVGNRDSLHSQHISFDPPWKDQAFNPYLFDKQRNKICFNLFLSLLAGLHLWFFITCISSLIRGYSCPGCCGSAGWSVVPCTKGLQVQFPVKGTYPCCRFDPGQDTYETTNQCFCLSFFFSLVLPHSLSKINWVTQLGHTIYFLKMRFKILRFPTKNIKAHVLP